MVRKVERVAPVMPIESFDKPRCQACGSRQVLYAKRTDTLSCRVCGNTWVRAKQGGKRS